jgi:hypothetical protein
MTASSGNEPSQPDVVVVGPDGEPVPTLLAIDIDGDGVPDVMAPLPPRDGSPDDAADGSLGELVSQPAKVMRIGSMIKQLLDEVKSAPLDEASRARLRDIHARSIAELEDGLAQELVDELERLSLPFDESQVPSEAELRIAQAQLVGWLEGLFHGIQTALFAQQMAARAQFEEMRRRALPPGAGPMMQGGVMVAGDGITDAGAGRDGDRPSRTSGPYL